MTIYLVMEENSPSLAEGYGGYELMGAYDSFDKAKNAVETLRYDIEKQNEFRATAEEDLTSFMSDTGMLHWVLMSQNGDRQSKDWFEIQIIKTDIQ